MDARSKSTFQNNITFVREEWSEKEVTSFVLKVEVVIELMKRQPEMYSPSGKKRRC